MSSRCDACLPDLYRQTRSMSRVPVDAEANGPRTAICLESLLARVIDTPADNMSRPILVVGEGFASFAQNTAALRRARQGQWHGGSPDGHSAGPRVCFQTHAAGAFGPGPSGKSLMDGTQRQRTDPVGNRHLPCDVIIPLERSRIQPHRSALGSASGAACLSGPGRARWERQQASQHDQPLDQQHRA